MNWTKLIEELMAKGYTQEKIAELCGGVTSGCISHLYTGIRKEPKWALGDALIKLNKRKKR